MCDELIVAVTTDEYTLRIKNNRPPIIPYSERREILQSLRYVDRVVFQDIREDEDFIAYILRIQEELQFDIIFKGNDVAGTERWIRLAEALEKRGVKVMLFPYTVTTSSTIIREKLEKY